MNKVLSEGLNVSSWTIRSDQVNERSDGFTLDREQVLKSSHSAANKAAHGFQVRESTVAQVEIFVIFTDPAISTSIDPYLTQSGTRFTIWQFDAIEPFLLHLMRHPNKHGAVRIAVSQHSFSGMSGVDALPQLAKLEPSLKTILVGDNPGTDGVIHAWRQGAADFVLKPCSIRDISHAILRVIQSNPISGQNFSGPAEPEAIKLLASLTRREREVFKLVVQGQANKAVAQELCISLPTVKMHRANLMRKLGLANVAQLSAFYHNCISHIG
ncbi:MAG: LuxR C-terminal-related transcriptional regulator [Orrella sp.]